MSHVTTDRAIDKIHPLLSFISQFGPEINSDDDVKCTVRLVTGPAHVGEEGYA